MFEKFKSPALFMAKNAVLSAFATAKQTALVVDAGHDATTGGQQ
jgi:actin-like protein 6A